MKKLGFVLAVVSGCQPTSAFDPSALPPVPDGALRFELQASADRPQAININEFRDVFLSIGTPDAFPALLLEVEDADDGASAFLSAGLRSRFRGIDSEESMPYSTLALAEAVQLSPFLNIGGVLLEGESITDQSTFQPHLGLDTLRWDFALDVVARDFDDSDSAAVVVDIMELGAESSWP